MERPELSIDQACDLLSNWSRSLVDKLERVWLLGELTAVITDPVLRDHGERLRRSLRAEVPALMEEVNGAFEVLAAAMRRG